VKVWFLVRSGGSRTPAHLHQSPFQMGVDTDRPASANTTDGWRMVLKTLPGVPSRMGIRALKDHQGYTDIQFDCRTPRRCNLGQSSRNDGGSPRSFNLVRREFWLCSLRLQPHPRTVLVFPPASSEVLRRWPHQLAPHSDQLLRTSTESIWLCVHLSRRLKNSKQE